MVRWKRNSRRYLTKTVRLTDGEFLHLLVSQRAMAIDERDERIYESLTDVQSAAAKALAGSVVATALAVLAYLGALQRLSASGLEVSPAAFSHIALVAMSVTTAVVATYLSKLSFVQAWFARKFEQGTGAERAQCLLLYPQAYSYPNFLRTNIGYPPHVFRRATGLPQLVFLALLLILVLTYLVGFVALWGALAIEVWSSSALAHAISVLTVIFSVAALVVAVLSPLYYDIPRTYEHFGLVNLLNRLEGDRLTNAHQRIARTAIRMGLVDDHQPKG